MNYQIQERTRGGQWRNVYAPFRFYDDAHYHLLAFCGDVMRRDRFRIVEVAA